MRVIPVIDLKGGQAVHAIGGDRTHYEPVQSELVASADPVALADAYRGLGLNEVYLADLDAIAGASPCLSLYERILSLGMSLLLDAGIVDRQQAAPVLDFAQHRSVSVVVGLESIFSPAALRDIAGTIDLRKLIFSLDLKHDRPLGLASLHNEQTPLNWATSAIDAGVRRIIVLDLADVGRGRGTSTAAICRSIRNAAGSELELIAGGGVRQPEDFTALADHGCDAALVATALHTGAIRKLDLQKLQHAAGRTV